MRDAQHRQHQASIEAEAMRRLEAELESRGALHLPSASGEVGFQGFRVLGPTALKPYSPKS